MKTRYRWAAGIIGFLLALLTSLSGQSSLGFEITGNSAGDVGKQEILYKSRDGQQFSNKLDPPSIENLSAQKAARFLDTQYKEKLIVSDIHGNFNYTDWKFKVASDEELNSLRINNYYICVPDKKCPDTSYYNENKDNNLFGFIGSIGSALGGVGLYIDLTYFSNKSDRIPGLKNLHWIQFVEDDSQTDDKGNAHKKPFIDVLKGNLTPYYNYNQNAPAGTGIVAGTYFVDRPYTSRPEAVYADTHDWKAELYLVRETASKTVTIYDGIRYGYHNEKNSQISIIPCNQTSSQSKSENKQNDNSCRATGHSANDPHLVTFDGLKYDLQTVGEFILIKSNNSDFEVQARQTPYNNSASVSINSAVAMKVGKDRVALYAQGFPDADTKTPLRVNGKATSIEGDKLVLKGGGEILKQGSNYVISVPTGEKVLVSLSGSFLNISPIVHNRSGKYNGLLGNVNGKPNDDQQIRGGGNVLKVQSTYGDVNKVLDQVGLRLPGALDKAEKVYFDQLYKEFANSWRVKEDESLFDYPAGKTTKSYLDPSFPDQYLKLDMLSPEQIEKASNACKKAKVSQDLMEGCIFDVGFSGYSEFARATAEINGYVNIVNQLFPGSNIPTTRQVGDQIIQKVKPKKVCAFGICL